MSRHPIICTSVSLGDLSRARVLAGHVANHSEGELLRVLLVDGDAGLRAAGSTNSFEGEPFVTLGLGDLGISTREIHELAMCTTGRSLAASFAPALVRSLLEANNDRPVVYLSPEVALFARLDELGERAESGGVALVPRILSKMPDDNCTPREDEIVERGSFDPGIVAVGQSGRQFCDWWFDAVREEATREGADLSRRQRFLDLAPIIFEVEVVRDPGQGVAYWNAHEREVKRTSDGAYEVRGLKLATVHFEGFSTAHPTLLSTESGGHPRGRLSRSRAVSEIVQAYRTELDERESTSEVAEARFARLGDDTLVSDRMRQLYRRGLRESVATGSPAPPDPFGPDGPDAFYSWLSSPDPGNTFAPTLPRYLAKIYEERADLRWTFRRVGTVDAPRFREWAGDNCFVEDETPSRLVASLTESKWWRIPTGVVSSPASHLKRGVQVVGYLRAEAGVGEAARLLYGALRTASVDTVPITLDRSPSRQMNPFENSSELAERDVNLVCVNADQLSGFASIVGPSFFEGRYTIASWVWETEHLPEDMAVNARFADEIWVPSTYVRDAVSPAVNIPVTVIAYPIVAPQDGRPIDLTRLGISQKFVFLFMFDFLSSFQRKNPIGVISSFITAFKEAEGPILLLKSVNGEKHPEDFEEMLLAVDGRRDVVVLDEYLSTSDRGRLIAACDCFVSLHRSEGFGLLMAEAMALGKPVIATGYSGNLDFMDSDTAYLVPSTRTLIGPRGAPYPAEHFWSDPDLDVAAQMMRLVYENREDAVRVGLRAREAVLANYPLRGIGSTMTKRLTDIGRSRRRGFESPVVEAVRRTL